MRHLIPINNSIERFVEVQEVDSGLVFRYARKYQNKWIYGRNWFIPHYVWQVLKQELTTG
jgi:hypothetical protein